MQLSTIDMTREEAETALAEWGAAIKADKVAAEDQAIADGYRALASGRKLIALTPTIAAGGEDDLHRPRLAVAPARATTIYLHRTRGGTLHYSVTDRPRSWRWESEPASIDRRITVPNVLARVDDWRHPDGRSYRMDTFGWQAMVPVVPPRFRTRGWKSCHVLFEAEWATHDPPAPVDPALIQHLRGDLWIVRGVWDLTPLERAVLMERNRP